MKSKRKQSAENKVVTKSERQIALDFLLRPITWCWTSSIRSRQNLVSSRHQEVRSALPFLDEQERELAMKWFKEEAHDGLWE